MTRSDTNKTLLDERLGYGGSVFQNHNLSLVEVFDPRIILKGLSSLLAMGSAKVVTLLTFLRGLRP
jgi:hypothetical protein